MIFIHKSKELECQKEI